MNEDEGGDREGVEEAEEVQEEESLEPLSLNQC